MCYNVQNEPAETVFCGFLCGRGEIMPVKVEVRMDVQSMTDFMLYQIYSSGAGVLVSVLAVINIVLTIVFAVKGRMGLMALYAAFAVVLLVVFPYMIKKKVRKQMSSSRRLNIPVIYEFEDSGVTTTTPQDSGKASWKKFKKAVSRKRIIMLFDEQKQAIILPVDQIEDNYTAIVDLIYKNMPAPAVRIRRLDKRK